MLRTTRLLNWLARKRYQYEVTFSLYMLTPTEKFIFNSFLILFLSMVLIAALLYLPEHIATMASRAWFYYAGDEAAAAAATAATVGAGSVVTAGGGGGAGGSGGGNAGGISKGAGAVLRRVDLDLDLDLDVDLVGRGKVDVGRGKVDVGRRRRGGEEVLEFLGRL